MSGPLFRLGQINQLREIVGAGFSDEILQRALTSASGSLESAVSIVLDITATSRRGIEVRQKPAPDADDDDDIIILESDSGAVDATPLLPTAFRRQGALRFGVLTTPGGTWPKNLCAVQVSASTTQRGPIAGLYTDTVVVWHEVNALGISSAVKGKGHWLKRVIDFASNGAGAGSAAPELLTDTNVRFALIPARAASVYLSSSNSGSTGPQGISAIGRLPPEFARCVSPLLADGSVRVSGSVVQAPDTISVGSTLTLLLTVQVTKHARRLMRFRRTDGQTIDPFTTGGGVGKATPGAPMAVTAGAVATQKELRLRACLFELVYFCLNGSYPPKPQLAGKDSGACGAGTPKPSPAPEGNGSGAGGDGEDAEAAPENTEERVDASVVQAVYATSDRVPPLPCAVQPLGLRNIQLRPYQLQALYWATAREAGGDATAEADAASAAAGCSGVAGPASVTQRESLAGLIQDAARSSSSLGHGGAGASSSSAATSSLLGSGAGGMWQQNSFEDRTPLWLNPFTRSLSLAPPPLPRGCRGGIIADEMGLGKTAELVSLVVAQMERKGWLEGRLLYPPPPAAARPAVTATTAHDTDDEDEDEDEVLGSRHGGRDPHGLDQTEDCINIEDDDDDDEYELRMHAGSKRRAGSGDTSRAGAGWSKRPREDTARLVTPAAPAARGRPASRSSLDLHADDEDDGIRLDEDATDASGSKLPKLRATLVVSPMVMMSQWKREIEKYTVTHGAEEGGPAASSTSLSSFGGTGLRVLLHYGPVRTRDSSVFHMYDVVVTSYGTVASEYDSVGRASEAKEAGAGAARVLGFFPSASVTPASGGGPSVGIPLCTGAALSPLFAVQWERVALDEAHSIKNRSTKVARACFDLRSSFRWCLSGTPIQNSLQDLYALLRFLRHEPWSELLWWKRVLAEPFERKDPRALRLLQGLLHPILLRRTKNMMDIDGRPIMGDLREPDVQVLTLELSAEEREFYNVLYHRSKLQFQGIVATKKVVTQYAAIFTLLLRLRQACDHPLLVLMGVGAALARADAASRPANGYDDDDDDEASAVPSTGAGSSVVGGDFVSRLYGSWLEGVRSRPIVRAGGGVGAPPGLPPVPAFDPALTQPEDREEDHSFVLSQLDSLRSGGLVGHDCPVCLDPLTELTTAGLPCAHLMCVSCMHALPVARRACPICTRAFTLASAVVGGFNPNTHSSSRAPASEGDTGYVNPLDPRRLEGTSGACAGALAGHGGRVMVERGEGDARKTAADTLVAASLSRESLRDAKRSDIPSSTKLNTLKEHLSGIAAHNVACEANGGVGPAVVSTVAGMVLEGSTKVIVFSQFTTMLDLIERTLKGGGLSLSRGYARLDGTMSAKQRDEAMAAFRTESRVFVFLISLKAGGLGLNLTEASVLYLVDPWWNPAVEHQALARVHRLGQTKQVYVRRFVAAGTVEVQMLAIQDKKRALADTALASGTGSAGGDAGAANKLTEEDLSTFFAR